MSLLFLAKNKEFFIYNKTRDEYIYIEDYLGIFYDVIAQIYLLYQWTITDNIYYESLDSEFSLFITDLESSHQNIHLPVLPFKSNWNGSKNINCIAEYSFN